MKREVIVFILLISAFLAIGCTESNSGEQTTISDTSTSGSDLEVNADGVTEIVPREASEGEINSIFEDPSKLNNAIFTSNEYGDIFVGASISLPAIVYLNDDKQEGVLIEGPYEKNGGLYLEMTNIGTKETSAMLYFRLQDKNYPPLLRSDDYIALTPGLKTKAAMSTYKDAKIKGMGIILYY